MDRLVYFQEITLNHVCKLMPHFNFNQKMNFYLKFVCLCELSLFVKTLTNDQFILDKIVYMFKN